MPKLKLDLDTLAVTSFDPAPEEKVERGTVEAHLLDPTRRTACPTCRTLCLPYC
jgi:hypothetical protein